MDSKNVDDDEETLIQPTVSSNDPSERKLARRLRIKRRLENAEKLKLIAENKYEEPEPENPLIDETIETSENILQQLYLDGKELVSNIRVASDSTEVERRKTEMLERNIRLEQLREESASALEKLNEISTKWKTIVETSGPLELHQHMKEQKAKCLELISQKNDLIKSFQSQLKIADEKFMSGRKAMYEELALLTKRIDEQVLVMKRAYRIELDHIEESVDITRSQLTEKHMKTWQSLYNQRERDEVNNMHRKFDMVDNFQVELHKLHQDHQEKFRKTRIQLESDIQMLEQELEQIKVLCLLNSEKLDYNYQVLKKREEENVYIKNHQKRRLNKLQDMVNSIKKKIDEKRLSAEDELKKLTKEVERYHANVLNTEKKADWLAEVNDEKFHNIWDMKDDEAKELINKILSVDRVIHEQILGLPWTSPQNPVLHKQDLPSYKAAENVCMSLGKMKKPKNEKIPEAIPQKYMPESQEVTTGKKRLMRHILELIADQTGFLMEEKLDELLKPYTDEEKSFVRLDNVFAAINIQTEKDMETMRNIFQPYAVCLLCDKRDTSLLSVEYKDDILESYYKSPTDNRQASILQMRELEEKVSKLRIQAKKEEGEISLLELNKREPSDSNRDENQNSRAGLLQTRRESSQQRRSTIMSSRNEDAVECDVSHPLVIEKFYVLKALKNFVSVFHADRCGVLTGMATRLAQKRYTISRILTKEDIISYWEEYKSQIPSKIENVWNAVFLALSKYLNTLQERHELNKKAHQIKQQNMDLKRLLIYYKNSINEENLTLPVISSVPDGPFDPEDMAQIVKKLSV